MHRATILQLLRTGNCSSLIGARPQPVLEALAAKKLSNARLLYESLNIYDVVVDGCSYNALKGAILTDYLYYLGTGAHYESLVHASTRVSSVKLSTYPLYTRFNLDVDIHRQGLEMMLVKSNVRVDVDLMPRVYDCMEASPLQRLYDEKYALDNYRSTLVDWCFYRDQKLFEKIVQYSSALPLSDITRRGVCLAARQGKQALRHYMETMSLNRDDSDPGKFLQLILAEHFVIIWRHKPNMRTIWGFLDYGVDISLPALKQDESFLLKCLVRGTAAKMPLQDILRKAVHEHLHPTRQR